MTRSHHGTTALALVLLLVAACGSSSKATPATTTVLPTTLPPSTTTTPPPGLQSGYYTTTITPADLAKGAHDAADVPGTWAIRVIGDGTMDVVLPDNIKVNFTYTVSGTQFVIGTDDHGVCAGSGTYTLDAQAGSLTFHLVSDACKVRAYLLPVHPWIKAT